MDQIDLKRAISDSVQTSSIFHFDAYLIYATILASHLNLIIFKVRFESPAFRYDISFQISAQIKLEHFLALEDS